MKRRSERGKAKPATTEESSEKSTRKSNRHTRRRRKSSSSSDESNKSPNKEVESISQPLNLGDIELPKGENPTAGTANNSEVVPTKSEEAEKEWKEDTSFWETDTAKRDLAVKSFPRGYIQNTSLNTSSLMSADDTTLPTNSNTTDVLQPTKENVTEENSKEVEESSLWKVQSSNGAGGGGEIQKLKICRQRPTESPELPGKRSNQGPKDSRSTDDSTQEESEKDTKKKHRTRTSSRNSPMISPTVVCDMSEGSPTKIKIINVGLITTGNKAGSVTKTTNSDAKEENEGPSNEQPVENSLELSEIALPTTEPPPAKQPEVESEEEKSKEPLPEPPTLNSSAQDDAKPADVTLDDSTKLSPKMPSPMSSSPKKDEEKSLSSGSSRSDTDSSGDKSKPRKVKKKRRRELQSTVQRKQESSDSEDEETKKKTEADRRSSADTQEMKDVVNGKENEAESSANKENNVEENKEKDSEPSRPMLRKRRWGSSKANRPSKKPILSISTVSLKSLIPDAKPVPPDELQLSVEEEEGQLVDDESEDEVVVLVAKEEEKQLERERQKEEKQKEREKEIEGKRKRKERFEKIKSDQPTSNTTDKGSASRKILLLTDDAKKLARSPSPPRRKPTSVLFITHLVRPFTVQQLKNLLLRTGTIAENGFWIDKIKSKCYVEYTTEDAAVETRHALHGVRWPTSNPKTLVVEFATHDDLIVAQTLAEEPEVPRKSEPLTMVEGWVADQARIKERSRRTIVREWDVGKPEHPDEVLEYDLKVKEKKEQERKSRKERRLRSGTPEAEPPARKSRRKEEDAPSKLLDDLFKKTKTSPCIYWLPLTQEQIAVKEEIRRQHMAEHERRMAELKKVELARRDRERRTRK